jgi:hypothetical protein
MPSLDFIDPGVPFPPPNTPSEPDAPTAPETPYIDPDMPGGEPLPPDADLPREREPEPELPEPDRLSVPSRAHNDI